MAPFAYYLIFLYPCRRPSLWNFLPVDVKDEKYSNFANLLLINVLWRSSASSRAFRCAKTPFLLCENLDFVLQKPWYCRAKAALLQCNMHGFASQYVCFWVAVAMKMRFSGLVSFFQTLDCNFLPAFPRCQYASLSVVFFLNVSPAKTAE